MVLSWAVTAEYREVFSRKKLQRYLSEEDTRLLLAILIRQSAWIDHPMEIVECRDPKDDKFLALAISGRATHVVSGDADLLALDPFRGIRIVTPRQFLEI